MKTALKKVDGLAQLNDTLDMFMPKNSKTGKSSIDGLNIEVRLVVVTPILATKILAERNTLNRKLNPISVNLLTKEMLADKWVFNGETISFDKNGILSNGQHRLESIVKSNKSQTLLVVTGIGENGFETIDIGLKRSASDTLSIYNIQDPTLTASIVKFIYAFENGKYSANRNTVRNLNNQEIYPYYLNLKNITDSVTFTKDMSKRGQSLVSPSTVGGLHYLMSKIDVNMANDFIEKMCVGTELDESSPITALRKKLISAKTNPKYKLTNESLLENIVRTWNLSRLGVSASKIRINSDFVMELK